MPIKAFRMKVYEDKHDEYKKRHDELWPEMQLMLKEHGALNYHIFLDSETSFLFAYLEITDEQLWQKTSETAICKKWWSYMQDIMETNEDTSPVSKELVQVFQL